MLHIAFVCVLGFFKGFSLLAQQNFLLFESFEVFVCCPSFPY